jgi:putative ABC transport system substrate-binding protein
VRAAFVSGLSEYGYSQERNLTLDERWAEGSVDRLQVLAAELVALKPDVLVGQEVAAVALRSRTTTIPIVLPGSSDPVAALFTRRSV